MLHLCANVMLWLREHLADLRLKSGVQDSDPGLLADQDRLQLEQENANAELREWLQDKLSRSPTWLEGHLKLGELSLASNQIACAYASAHAAKILSSKFPIAKQERAALLLARCYLKRGAAQQALEVLSPFQKLNQRSVALSEELAAVHLALGNYADVLSVLHQIDPTKLSSSTKAALDHAKFKMN